ncbi:MAG: nucleoside 2-deoxyribosyltransferase, partial [Chloroflexota bacterium]
MKAYLAIKYHPDHQNRSLIEGISHALAKSGIETVCVTRDIEQWGVYHFSPEELMQRSFAEIDASDLVLIELSEKGVGLGIEAGYAYAKRIPIITIAQQGADISTTLQGISQKVYFYDTTKQLADFI